MKKNQISYSTWDTLHNFLTLPSFRLQCKITVECRPSFFGCVLKPEVTEGTLAFQNRKS